jgi:peroxiredoxin
MPALKSYLTLFLFAASIACAFAQQPSIVDGRAPDFKGQEVTLHSFSDLITYTQVKESADTVDQKGMFELSTLVDHPQAFLVKIGNQSAKLYMLKAYKYGVTFPAPDPVDSGFYQNPNAEQSTDLIIYGDSTELNARIIDFNTQFERFWNKNYKYFVAKKLHTKLDSFELAMRKRYEGVNSSYLRVYTTYSMALINDNTGRHRTFLAQRYILNKPIHYHNYEYMEFFNQFFKQYLQQLTVGKFGNEILGNINEQPNYMALNAVMTKDPWMANDSLRELVLLKGLFELYYIPGFKKENIIALTEQLKASTKNEEHRLIADNMLHIFRNLQNGATAPAFALKDAKEGMHQLSDFKGKIVYLDFFSPKNLLSLQEMKKLEQIKNKMSCDKIAIIGICMEGEEEEFRDFVKKNPKFNWLLLYGTKDKQVLDAYLVKAPATYYMINQEGYLVQSPATPPSKGIEFKFNEICKKRKR